MFKLLDIYDLIALAGLILVGVGAWLIWPPAALITVGGLMLGISLAGAVQRSRG